MPPRVRMGAIVQFTERHIQRSAYICSRCQYATAAAATTPASSDVQITHDAPHISRYSVAQPPSHRDPRYRKSQLLRSYVSMLQSTPLIILFQHNNLKAMEWASIRRELANALQKVDDQLLAQGKDQSEMISDAIKLQVVQTNILDPALRITEYYKTSLAQPTDRNAVPLTPATLEAERFDPTLTHALSQSAYTVSQANRNVHPLTPLLAGSIALLNFPSMSTAHVKAALSILAPQAPAFPAPTRRANPTYHEPPVQDGLKKLMLLGARADGQIFDMEGTRWIGSIDGGIDGLRAQLVSMLQGFGAGLARTLEGASRSLWFTVEGRRRMLEEESKPKEEAKTEEGSS